MRFSPATPLGFLEMLLRDRYARARAAEDRGASAVEWVVISAIVVGIVIVVGGILLRALQTKSEAIEGDIGGAGGGGGP
jgi:Flp pilus assembly pilin Flp